MSELVTFTAGSAPDPREAGVSLGNHPLPFALDGTAAPQGEPAVHCGTVMRLVSPAVMWERASYTFAPASNPGLELPPVWRCACGFQLDAWPAENSRAGRASATLPA